MISYKTALLVAKWMRIRGEINTQIFNGGLGLNSPAQTASLKSEVQEIEETLRSLGVDL